MAQRKPDRPPEINKTRELEILNHVARALSESVRLEEVLNTALNEAMKALNTDHGGIYLLDPESKKLRLKVEYQLTNDFLREKSNVALGDGCAGTAAVTKEIYSALGQPDKALVCEDAERLMGVDCLVAAPILYKGRVLGVLELFAHRARKLTAPEAELLQSLLSHIAVAIETANAHEEIRHSLENSKILLQAAEAVSSVLELEEVLARLTGLAAKSLAVGRVRILLYDEQRNEYVMAAGMGAIPKLGSTYRAEDLSRAQRHVLDTARTATAHYSTVDLPGKRLGSDVITELVTPLVFKGTSVGILLFDEPGQDRQFDADEVALAEGLGRHAAVAIANARAYRQQEQIASTLQRSFLPLSIPRIKGFDTGAYYGSATSGALVGGDFYDVIKCAGDTLVVAIGDVSGKGIKATATAAATKNTIHLLCSEDQSPSGILSRANDLMAPQITGSQFVTVSLVTMHTPSGHILYANAGHPPPLLFHAASGKSKTLPVGDVPIGVAGKPIYQEYGETMSPGDVLLLYTDGAIETRADGEFFGEERLRIALEANAKGKAQDLVEAVVEAVKYFSEGRLTDDIALLCIKRTSEVPG